MARTPLSWALGALINLMACPAMAQAIPDNPGAQPAGLAQPSGDPAAEVSTGLDRSLRMTVPVMINGQGPFDFVVDTGADRTVISEELAKQLGLPQSGTATLHAMGGSAKVRLVRIGTVQVSTNTARHVQAAALPRRNIGADGLLGIDSLKNQRIVMDFQSHTFRVEPAAAPEETVPDDAEQIIVTARTRLGQLVMVDADANGQKIWVVVDTGAQNSIANTRLRALLVKRAPDTEIRSINMVDVLGRSTLAEYTIVRKLRIGGISMGNAAIAFADAHPFRLFGLLRKPSMLLGVEGLRSFRRVSVDFATRKVKFLLPEEG